jgi:hypothetical protein
MLHALQASRAEILPPLKEEIVQPQGLVASQKAAPDTKFFANASVTDQFMRPPVIYL